MLFFSNIILAIYGPLEILWNYFSLTKYFSLRFSCDFLEVVDRSGKSVESPNKNRECFLCVFSSVLSTILCSF